MNRFLTGRNIVFSGVALLAIAAIAVIAILVARVLPLISETMDGLDFEGMEVKVVGWEEFKDVSFLMESLLPVAQLFIGEAVSVEEAEIEIETGEVATEEFSVTLPPGWSQVDEHSTDGTLALLLENEDGDFATVIAVDSPADPDQYIQDFIAEHNHLLDMAGFTIATYSTITAGGYSAQAVDAEGPGLAVRLRGWYDEEAQKAYIVTLTCRPQNLLASQIILEGPSAGTAK